MHQFRTNMVDQRLLTPQFKTICVFPSKHLHGPYVIIRTNMFSLFSINILLQGSKLPWRGDHHLRSSEIIFESSLQCAKSS